MAKHKNILELSGETIIEMVVRKKVSLNDYKKNIKAFKDKGWDVKAYQLGFYSENKEGL